ncbi:MAG TPA: hypothetical protein VN927_07895 [Gemmatimonadaceae bacterium]|nr:hypothetical protein [Gemmatimonadaceae bacterium]
MVGVRESIERERDRRAGCIGEDIGTTYDRSTSLPLCGFYEDIEKEHHLTYSTNFNLLTSEENPV